GRYIMFVGDERGNTIITGNRNVAGGGGMTTTNSATVAMMGERFLARDITFQNTTGPSGGQAVAHNIYFIFEARTNSFKKLYDYVILKIRNYLSAVMGERFLARDIAFQNTVGPSGGQAVALRLNSDLSVFYKCGMEGYQDTLYVLANRQFYMKCFIIGTIDFIFGNAAVVFQFCDIHARKPNLGQMTMITTQGRMDKNQNTGIVIQKCSIGATADLKATKGSFQRILEGHGKTFQEQ
nr:pectinesterase/pectinesterase inhibitor 3 [Tanacetum cinerariifolium]